jgi:CO/xanthine dehydrogenase FAD-binding subunit
MHVAFADSYEPSGPFGAKGLGEIGLDAIPAAIANAISDAVGVRIYDLPITSEKIHRALHPELYANEEIAPNVEPKGSAWSRISKGTPSGPRQAVALYAAGDTALVSGGMSHALRRERTGYPFAQRLVSLAKIIELNQIVINAIGTVTVGSAVNQQRLYDDKKITQGWQAMDDALEAVGHTRLRRMITVGGSIGPLIAGFDLPIALLALNARVTVAGPAGRRTLTLEDAFQKRFAKDELVVSVEVDALPARTGSAFHKYMLRGQLEIPTVNVAARVTLDAAGQCNAARVVVGCVGWKPIVLDLSALTGTAFNEHAVRDAVQCVRTLAEPTSDVRGSTAYKREMAVEWAARMLIKAWQRAEKTKGL